MLNIIYIFFINLILFGIIYIINEPEHIISLNMLKDILDTSIFAYMTELFALLHLNIFKKKINLAKFCESKIILYCSFFALIIVACLNFYIICKTAVDVVFFDEWRMVISPDCLSRNFNLGWIFDFHNEHRIIWTKLITWLQYNIEGFNTRHQIIFNWFLYVFMLFWLYKIIPNKNSVTPLFFIPLFSNIHWFNFVTAFQSQFYFMLLFAFIAINFGFSKESSLKNTVLFSIFTVFSMFSMTFFAGVPLLFAFILKEGKFNKNAILASVLILSGLAAFIWDYKNLDIQTKILYPNQVEFWYFAARMFYKTIVNFDIDLRIYIWIFSYLILAASVFYLAYKERNKNREYLPLVLLFLFMGLVISAGRGSFKGLSSRHFITGSFIIPVLSGLIIAYKKQFLAITFILILFLGYHKTFSNGAYYDIKKERVSIRDEFLSQYNSNKKTIYVPKIYSSEFTEEQVKYLKSGKINLPFLKK